MWLKTFHNEVKVPANYIVFLFAGLFITHVQGESGVTFTYEYVNRMAKRFSFIDMNPLATAYICNPVKHK